MYEQEKQRSAHLRLLFAYTACMIALVAEALLLGWEMLNIWQLVAGLAICWILHISGKVPGNVCQWIYFVFMVLTFWSYGTHESSIPDLAIVMIALMILYFLAEVYAVLDFCVIVFFGILLYDVFFVIKDKSAFTPLFVSRLLLHSALILLVWRLMKALRKKNVMDKKDTDERIARLEEVNSRTEDFLTNVSHELRTPINAVVGLSAVMLNNEDDSDKRKDILSMQRAGYRLFAQIEDILDFTEIDTGRISVSEDNYMIASMVNDIVTDNRMMAQNNDLELIFDIDANIPTLLVGDGRKIKKIIKHLIDNSIKFTKKGGVYVRIYALKREYGVNLCIRVTDTGIGIDEEHIEKITEKFYQSSHGRDRQAGGLGLGIPIVHGMVRAMNGFMQIESQKDKGTTVSISIPQKVADDTPGMQVERRRELCVGCFLRPEKYQVTEVRNFYDRMITHMVRGLDITLHRVYDMDNLEKLVSTYKLTHLFIGKEEYEENADYFETMDQDVEVIVTADDDFAPAGKSRVKILPKPFYCFPVVGVLNEEKFEDASSSSGTRMVCPGVRILVVDDEPMNLMVAEGIFNDYQMKIKTANSGQKAIDICQNEEFDLIFIDHMMPGMDGVETLKRLRNIENFGNSFSAVVFTANAVSGSREMFMREGFDEFVSKPVEVVELERVLKKVLPKNAIVYISEQEEKNTTKRAASSKRSASPNGAATSPRGAAASSQRSTSPKGAVTSPNGAGMAKAKSAQSTGEQGEDELERLERAGINTRSGLSYSQKDREFYIKLLTKFAEDGEGKKTSIQGFRDQKDWENYRILVHALKSSSKMIGADALSELAKSLEDASKNQDAAYIEEHHEALMSRYDDTLRGIRDSLGIGSDAEEPASDGAAEEISAERLTDQFDKIQDYLSTFEASEAERCVEELRGFAYHGTPVLTLLRHVRGDIEDFEMDTASEKLRALTEQVKGGEL